MVARVAFSNGTAINCDGGADRYLTRTIHGENNGFVGVLESCTFGGIEGTILRQDFLTGNQLWYAEIGWTEAQIASAGAGLQGFVDVWDAAPPSDTATNYCVENVNQASPIRDSDVTSSTSGAPTTPTVDAGDDSLALEIAASGSGGAVPTWVNYTLVLSQGGAAYTVSAADQTVVSADAALATEYDFTSSNRSFLLITVFEDVGSVPEVPITGDLVISNIDVATIHMGITPAVNGMMHLDTPDSGGQLSNGITTPLDIGTMSPMLDGSFGYTPPGGFVGEAQFGYTAYEYGNAKPEVTIHVVVTPSSVSGTIDSTLDDFGSDVTMTTGFIGTIDSTLGAVTGFVQGAISQDTVGTINSTLDEMVGFVQASLGGQVGANDVNFDGLFHAENSPLANTPEVFNGEYGYVLRIGINEDISANTNSLLLRAPIPCFEEEFITVADGLVVGTVNKTADGFTYLAGEFIEYIIPQGLIDFAGAWEVCLYSLTPELENKFAGPFTFNVIEC